MKKIALAAVMLAVTAAPGFCTSYDDLNVAISYFDQKQPDSALPWFDKAIAAGDLIPDLTRIAYLDRGLIYAAKGDKQKAIADYTAAIAARPDDLLAYRERIAAYFANDDIEKALGDYEQLNKLRPHDYLTLMSIGRLNWQLNHLEAAADAFSYFSTVDTFAWLWLQLVNVRLGKPMTDYAEVSETRNWPGHIPRFYRGHLVESDVLEAAESTKDAGHICAANFFTGLWRVVHDDQTGAAPLLNTATKKCAEGSSDWRIARYELAKMKPGGKAE